MKTVTLNLLLKIPGSLSPNLEELFVPPMVALMVASEHLGMDERKVNSYETDSGPVLVVRYWTDDSALSVRYKVEALCSLLGQGAIAFRIVSDGKVHEYWEGPWANTTNPDSFVKLDGGTE